MKPLILILLAATYASAQTPTIADIARQERARRAPSTTTKVYTTADIKKPEPKAEEGAQPGAAEAPGAPAAAAPTAAPAQTPAAAASTSAAPAPAAAAPAATAAAPAPAEDPVQKWLADTEKLRGQIREIIDQEAVAQLEINSINNRVNAPVTTVADKDRALAQLGTAQTKLTGIREQLAKKRSELQARELEGPPKK